MTGSKTQHLKRVIDGMHLSRVHKLAASRTRGRGAILMLHQVCPPSGEPFEPSRILQITPEFLQESISVARDEGFDLISLDEVHRRLTQAPGGRPFLSFTLDDGYKDNLTHALPVFEANDVPCATYVPDTFADGNADLWWLVLEEVIRKARHVHVAMNGALHNFDVTTLADKETAHETIYWWLRSIDEDEARAIVHALACEQDVDAAALSRDLIMTWDEIRTLQANPLVTIAAHTSGHYALAKLPQERMKNEIANNLRRLEEELGERPTHFSYPYGCEHSAGPREFAWLGSLGMKTAVTTRKGMLFPEHASHMTALPRLSLNGDFQDAKSLKVLLSGLPFALWNKGRRLNVS